MFWMLSFLLKMDLTPWSELFDFHEVSMTHYCTDNWEKTQNFEVRPDSILIVTYPKAGQAHNAFFFWKWGVWVTSFLFSSVFLWGNTWVSYILDQLYFDQTSPEHQHPLPIYRRVPWRSPSLFCSQVELTVTY